MANAKPLMSREELNGAFAVQKKISKAAQDEVETVWNKVVAPTLRDEGISRNRRNALVRDILEEQIPAIVDKFGGAAGKFAADFYADLRSRVKKGTFDAILSKPSGHEYVKQSVRDLLGGLWDEQRFQDPKEAMKMIVDRYVNNQGRGTMIENCLHDKGVFKRYARVPFGGYTCPFCLLLASRGAVYVSEESAGMFNQWHSGCDCAVLPSYEGREIYRGFNRDTQMYYDVYAKGRDKFYEEHSDRPFTLDEFVKMTQPYYDDAKRDCLEALGINPNKVLTKIDKALLNEELQSRNIYWVYFNEKSDVNYLKKRKKLEETEKHSLDYLLDKGFNVTVNKHDDGAKANIDFSINGRMVEEKSPKNASLGSMAEIMDEAISKWDRLELKDPVEIVWTNWKNYRKDSEVKRDLIDLLSTRPRVKKLMFIDSSGKGIYLRK